MFSIDGGKNPIEAVYCDDVGNNNVAFDFGALGLVGRWLFAPIGHCGCGRMLSGKATYINTTITLYFRSI